jgi:hypothetical protein
MKSDETNPNKIIGFGLIFMIAILLSMLGFISFLGLKKVIVLKGNLINLKDIINKFKN